MHASSAFGGRSLSQYSQFGRSSNAIAASLDCTSESIATCDGVFPPIAPQNPPSTLVVEIVLFQRVNILDVAGPMQVFATANEQASAGGGTAPYAIRVAGVDPTIVSSSGINLTASPLPIADEPVDTLIVAGGVGVHDAMGDRRLTEWLARRALTARRVASVCTGAFLLGAAGLLNGRRVVTHWNFCDELARLYPETSVESDPIYIRDEGIWSSAGVSAGMDLALAMVEEDVGRTLAVAVARDLVMYLKRPGGQSQFSAILALQHHDDKFERLHAWMADRLSQDLSISALAAQCAMSERSFVRTYAAAVGMTPARAVERLRIEAAQQLLISSPLSIKQIAAKCGFGSEETMRRSFRRVIAIAPKDYRERFS